MPLLENPNTFLNTLSDFWRRFFKDIDDLKAVYEGTTVVLGQVYLNFLSDVLRISVNDAPLFNKEYYKLIVIREDQVAYLDGETPKYVYRGAQEFKNLPLLQNKVFNPSAALEQGFDYTVDSGRILFETDPTSQELAGHNYRSINIVISGLFSEDGVDWAAAGVKKGDRLVLENGSAMTVIKATAESLALSAATRIPSVILDNYTWSVRRTLSDGTEVFITSGTNGRFENTTTLTVKEVSFWAPDALVDNRALYVNFGHMLSESPRASTETYRAFIRGLMQLYILGPAIDRLESGLNVIAGLPIVSEEGEKLRSYDSGVTHSGTAVSLAADGEFVSDVPFTAEDVGGYVKITGAYNAANNGTFKVTSYLSPYVVKLESAYPFEPEVQLDWTFSRTGLQTITTDQNTYTLPWNIPVRADLKDPANFEKVTLRAFETLTEAIRVTDYISDPTWWHGITVPRQLLPDMSMSQRVVSTHLLPNLLGAFGQAHIGDPGFYVGADENGTIPEVEGASPLYRHRVAFILVDRFLKAHLFGVQLSPELDWGGNITEMQEMLNEVKPSHTELYFHPFTVFTEEITISEADFEAGAKLKLPLEPVYEIDNSLYLDGTWQIGDGFMFDAPSGSYYSVTSLDGIPFPWDGFTPLALGGQTPSIQTRPVPTSEVCYIDRPIQITVRNA